MDGSRGLAKITRVSIYPEYRTFVITRFASFASLEIAEISTLGAHTRFTEIYLFIFFTSELLSAIFVGGSYLDRPVVAFPTLSVGVARSRPRSGRTRTLALDLTGCTLRARSPLDRSISRTRSEPKRAVSFYITRRRQL